LFELLLFELSVMPKNLDLSREEINYLLREYFESIREQVREDWRSTVQNETFNYDEAICGLEEYETELKNFAAQDKLPKWTEYHSEQLLYEYDVAEKQVSKANKSDLAERVLQAQLEGFRILRARYSGRFDEI